MDFQCLYKSREVPSKNLAGHISQLAPKVSIAQIKNQRQFIELPLIFAIT